MSESHWISPAEAGHRLHVTSQWARKLAQAGKVRAMETPLGWLLDEADVERLRLERAQAGTTKLSSPVVG